MPKYEVGKTYKVLDAAKLNRQGSITVANGSNTFTCHMVDRDGDCWSDDLAYLGEVCGDGEGWCVGSHLLKEGTIVEL